LVVIKQPQRPKALRLFSFALNLDVWHMSVDKIDTAGRVAISKVKRFE
jgi:hypothetical protein